MQFEVYFYVKVHPTQTSGVFELNEHFSLTVDANSYSEAQEKAFKVIKQATSFDALMSKLIANNIADTKELIKTTPLS